MTKAKKLITTITLLATMLAVAAPAVSAVDHQGDQGQPNPIVLADVLEETEEVSAVTLQEFSDRLDAVTKMYNTIGAPHSANDRTLQRLLSRSEDVAASFETFSQEEIEGLYGLLENLDNVKDYKEKTAFNWEPNFANMFSMNLISFIDRIPTDQMEKRVEATKAHLEFQKLCFFNIPTWGVADKDLWKLESPFMTDTQIANAFYAVNAILAR